MSQDQNRTRNARTFAPFEWMVAKRYLRLRQGEGFISVIAILSFIGIMLGVATLIIVLAVMNGFREELLGRLVGVNGHALVQPVGGDGIEDYQTLTARIASMAGVERVIPIVEGQVLVSGPKRSVGAYLRGVNAEDLRSLAVLQENLYGSLKRFGEINAVVLGKRLARRLGIKRGDTLTLLTPRGANTPFGVTPRARIYPVMAIFHVGMSEIDAGLVFLPLGEAQNFLNSERRAHAIEITLKKPEEARLFRETLAAELDENLRVRDWTQIHATLANALDVERNVMFIILTLIILVASLNVISSMIMLVKDKRGEIAMLRAMGATRGAVMRIFLMTGSSIGVVGTFAGLCLGLLFALNIETIRQGVSALLGANLFPPEIYFLSRLPAELDVYETVLVILVSLVLSFTATVYPAFRAASLEPAAALRYE